MRTFLKTGPRLAEEAAALEHFRGRAAVRVVEFDAARGELRLERLEPGTQLAELAASDDAAATAAAAGVMRALWRDPPARHRFPDVAEWGRALNGPHGPLPRALVERGRAEYFELCASSGPPVVLHGDLHHFNVLRHGDAWVAIDPKGLVGEPAYDAGALLRNPLPALLEHPRPGAVLARRIDQLSELLGFDRDRVRAWGRSQAVLAALWSVEDGDEAGWRFFARCAELLALPAGS